MPKKKNEEQKYIRPTLFYLLGRIVIKSRRNHMLNLASMIYLVTSLFS